jgi:RNA polymerase sigma-70 factor (ECF subfamily)
MPAADPAQFGRWFDAYAAQLVLYARHWNPEHGAAEDVVQDVFLRLVEQPEHPQNVKAWLYRAVRNAAISAARTLRRRKDREARVATERPEWFHQYPGDLIDARAAQDALAALPETQREVVILRIWARMTLQEVADTVALPLSTVHDQYRAALAAVRKQMESSCPTKKT